MAGIVYTFTGNANPQNGIAAIETSQGWVPVGQSGLFTATEYQNALQNGCLLTAGPAASPSSQLTAPTLAAGAAGNPSGAYRYAITFVTAAGETLAGPEATITVTSTQVSITNIPVGSATSGVTARKVYRTAAGGATGTEKLVTTINDNTTTTYTDNIADASLGAVLPAADTSAVVVNLTSFEWHQVLPGTTLANEGL